MKAASGSPTAGDSTQGTPPLGKTRPPFPPTPYFGRDVRRYLEEHPQQGQSVVDFTDSVLRCVMEPHIAKARRARIKVLAGAPSTPPFETSIRPKPTCSIPRHIQHIPVDTSRLRRALQELLQVEDLALLHLQQTTACNNTSPTEDQQPKFNKKKLLRPLLDVEARSIFHQAYHDLVREHVLPYVLSRIQHQDPCPTSLRFRYQAFPCLRVIRPGEFSIGPHCDAAYGHAAINLNVYVPLTQAMPGGTGVPRGVEDSRAPNNTASLFTESQPGREDWQALPMSLNCLSILDGAQCIHFTLENTTPYTRVSLDFRLALLQDDNGDNNSRSSSGIPLWNDRYTSPPGYYVYGTVELHGTNNEKNVPVFRFDESYWPRQVDARVGFPFGK